jgi:hypothetical protein
MSLAPSCFLVGTDGLTAGSPDASALATEAGGTSDAQQEQQPIASEGGTDASDGGALDGDAGVFGDSGDSGIQILVHDSFEARIDCDGWQAVGSAIPTTPGYLDGRSCKVCNGYTQDFTKTIGSAQPGTYVLTAELRSVTPDAGVRSIVIGIRDGTTNSPVGSATVGDTWTFAEGTRTLTAPITNLKVTFWTNDTGGCYLIDEIVLTYQP